MATILITGTNKGVGLELVKIYAARGDTVIATCRDPESASALSEVDGAVEVLGVSVGDDASVASLAKALEGRVIDVLINCLLYTSDAADE